jgi:hypothetical protein
MLPSVIGSIGSSKRAPLSRPAAHRAPRDEPGSAVAVDQATNDHRCDHRSGDAGLRPFGAACEAEQQDALRCGEIAGDDVRGVFHQATLARAAQTTVPRSRYAGTGSGGRGGRTARTICFANARHRPTVSKGAAAKSERPSQIKMDLWAQPAPRCRRRQTRLRQSPAPQCPQRRA